MSKMIVRHIIPDYVGCFVWDSVAAQKCHRMNNGYIKIKHFMLVMFCFYYLMLNRSECTSLLLATVKNANTNRTVGVHHAAVTGTMATMIVGVNERQIQNQHQAIAGDDDDYENLDGGTDDDHSYDYDTSSNSSVKGLYLGSMCEKECNPQLRNVICHSTTNTCGCEKNYPVVIGKAKGCAKPKKLGEQCFYHQTCLYNDVNSLCVQVKHNALCQCADGFHSVSYMKPTKKVFCTQDIAVLTSDLPTLLGVTSGIAVLAGLICMVLHLFSKTKYPRHRNFGNAAIPPPIMYSSDTGIPLTVHSARPSSRSSIRSSGSIGSFSGRRASSAPQHGSKGVLVSTSRTGSRRPSLASIHSTSSSVRSYSGARFEKELQQKEIRHEMKLRLAKLQQASQIGQQPQFMRPKITIDDTMMASSSRAILPTPSPMTPNSMDELLPVVDETQEV